MGDSGWTPRFVFSMGIRYTKKVSNVTGWMDGWMDGQHFGAVYPADPPPRDDPVSQNAGIWAVVCNTHSVDFHKTFQKIHTHRQDEETKINNRLMQRLSISYYPNSLPRPPSSNGKVVWIGEGKAGITLYPPYIPNTELFTYTTLLPNYERPLNTPWQEVKPIVVISWSASVDSWVPVCAMYWRTGEHSANAKCT